MHGHFIFLSLYRMKAGQGEVGTWVSKIMWLLLDLDIERPSLAMGGPFLSSFA